MNRFLVSDDHPAGGKLEDVLTSIRAEILTRCQKIALDERMEAHLVLANNIQILAHMTDCIELARGSTRLLDKSFGPSRSHEGGPPRIGAL
jgi:hypothetical protein